MEAALVLPSTGAKTRELQFRDSLLIALITLWLIRRRSLATLSVSGHMEIVGDDINLLLHDEDTKSVRPEVCCAQPTRPLSQNLCG